MMVSFAVQKLSSPVRSSFLIIGLNVCYLCPPVQKASSCAYSSIRFMVSGLTVRCLINSELVLCRVMDMDLPPLTVFVVEDAPLFSV